MLHVDTSEPAFILFIVLMKVRLNISAQPSGWSFLVFINGH